MILALRTDGPVSEFFLLDSTTSERQAYAQWESRRTLADELLPYVLAFLTSHHQTPRDLSAIIIFSGPGSFTSLRIGHTVANAFADGLGIPVVAARGDDWLELAVQALPSASPHQPVFPYYGAQPNITTRPPR